MNQMCCASCKRFGGSGTTDQCVDNDNGLMQVTSGAESSYAGAAAKGSCTHATFGPTMNQMCCASCKRFGGSGTTDQCVDNDNGLMQVTSGAESSCAGAAAKGSCTHATFGPTMNQMCCASCKRFGGSGTTDQCVDN